MSKRTIVDARAIELMGLQYLSGSAGWWANKLHYDELRAGALKTLWLLGRLDIPCESIHKAARLFFAVGWNLCLKDEVNDDEK